MMCAFITGTTRSGHSQQHAKMRELVHAKMWHYSGVNVI
jgi:hypothetical protein